MAQPDASLQRAQETLGNWRWRLNNLYYITDKSGSRVKFEMNWAQESLFNEMHYQNVILKARQLGFSTFIQIFMLDACVFNSNTRAGVIAHTLPDAQAIFRDKVKFPYDNLPDPLKALRSVIRDSASELALSNNSALSVSTSHRGGTLQYLHISELGKIAAKSPEKAREIRTGALNTVQAGNVIFIESTAEGQEGDFYRICEESQAHQRMGSKLTPLDFKFFFFPWWKEPGYRIDPDGVTIPANFEEYFARLAGLGIVLDGGQKAWYLKKAASQLGDMKREYPSTPKEAFEASVEGAYYGQWMEKAEADGRICRRIAEPSFPVHTAWDIGRSDYTSIWFWQRFVKEVRIVGFYQNCGEGLPHYAETLRQMYRKHEWSRTGAIDYVPHDARVTEWGSDKSRLEQMIAERLKPVIATELGVHDGINAARAMLPSCTFDEALCAEGIHALKNYRKEWDENLGKFKDMPRHDKHSHGADSFRYLACAHRDLAPVVETPQPDPIATPTLAQMTALHDRRMKHRGSTKGHKSF